MRFFLIFVMLSFTLALSPERLAQLERLQQAIDQAKEREATQRELVNRQMKEIEVHPQVLTYLKKWDLLEVDCLAIDDSGCRIYEVELSGQCILWLTRDFPGQSPVQITQIEKGPYCK